MITVEKINDTTFKVIVQGHTTTHHEVTVSPDYYQKLTKGKVSAEALVEQSFEFLLQRESNNSILTTFDLPVIGRYFPDYESTIKTMI
ncbi:MAG: hypothetical protein SVR94_05855 [Pseudomonadota bacterium]|nr:hypothetical protein [Pseudomonadota bacterium]